MPYTEKSLVYLSKDYRNIASFGAVGQSGSIGGAPIVDNNDPNLTDAESTKGAIFQEVFICDGIQDTFSVTENDGILPETADDVMITINGLYLNQSYIASLDGQGGTVQINFVPEAGDRIAVIWFFRGNDSTQTIFQQIIVPSGSSPTVTITENAGVIPARAQEMFIFVNGVFHDYKILSSYNPEVSALTLNYTPSNFDSLAFVWFTDLPNNLKILQENFVADGTSATYTVTENGGKLPKVKDAMLLMRNGQHINNDYISGFNSSTGTVTLSFTPDEGDDIGIIWFVDENVGLGAKLFQEQFTTDGVSNTLTVTKNNGKLPLDLDAIMIYRNGQFINNGFVQSHNPTDGTITFTFLPRINEKFTIVWVITK
jgi:hypothetical protein